MADETTQGARAPTTQPAPLTLNQQIDKLQEAINQFDKECRNPDGSLRKDKSWCEAEQTRLNEDIERLGREVEKLKQSAAQPVAASGQVDVSACTPQGDSPVNQGTDNIDKIVEALLSEPDKCEPSDETKVVSRKCMDEMECELIRTTFQSGEAFVEQQVAFSSTLRRSMKVIEAATHKRLGIDRCFSGAGQQSNCLVEFARGIFYDVWGNIKGLVVDLPKMIAHGTVAGTKWVGRKIVSRWKHFRGIEDKTSDALVTAGSLPERSVGQWFEDKAAFVKNFFVAFVNAINESIKDTYGCEAWSGAPYASQCLQPMQSWDCATCTQRLHAICGVVGYLTGEVVTGFLTGGAVALGKAIASKAAVMGAAGWAKVVQTMPKTAKVIATTAGVGARAVRGSYLATKAAYEALKNSRAVQAIQQGAAATKRFLTKTPVISTVTKVAVASTKVVTYPASRYFDLIAKATELGFEHGDRLAKILRLGDRVIMVEAASAAVHVGSLVPIEGEGIPPGVVLGPIRMGEKEVMLRASADGHSLVVDQVKDAPSSPPSNNVDQHSQVQDQP